MKAWTSIILTVLCCGSSSCFVYLDRPPERTFAGVAKSAATGEPVPDALVWIQSKRRIFTLLPVDTFDVVATTRTGSRGEFQCPAKVNWPATILINGDETVGEMVIENEAARRTGVAVLLAPKKPATEVD